MDVHAVEQLELDVGVDCAHSNIEVKVENLPTVLLGIVEVLMYHRVSSGTLPGLRPAVPSPLKVALRTHLECTLQWVKNDLSWVILGRQVEEVPYAP